LIATINEYADREFQAHRASVRQAGHGCASEPPRPFIFVSPSHHLRAHPVTRSITSTRASGSQPRRNLTAP